MTPEQATFLLNEVYLPQIRNEHQTTRRVIAAIPAEQSGYRPSPKCMSALELAWHMVSAEPFFMNGIVAGKYEPGGGTKPESVTTPADVLQWDDEHFEKAVAHLSAVKPEDLVRPIDFFGFMTFPAIQYATLMCSHSIHHRGQLSSYLRPMGAKVPRIYGPSGDEPMAM
jgi:uncharacterized damage-inducible protein DinB